MSGTGRSKRGSQVFVGITGVMLSLSIGMGAPFANAADTKPLPRGATRGNPKLAVPQTPEQRYYDKCVKEKIAYDGQLSATNIASQLQEILKGGSRASGATSKAGADSCGLVGEACPRAVSADSKNYNSCDAYSPDRVQTEKAALEAMLKANECRTKKFETLQNEFDCLQKENERLVQNVSQMKSAFAGEMQRLQKEMSQKDQELSDRKTQFSKFMERLNGDESTGRQGLRQIKAKLTAALELAGAPGGEGGASQSSQSSRSVIEEGYVSIKQARANVGTMIEEQAMARANVCFRAEPVSTLPVDSRGTPGSPYDHLLAMIANDARLSPSGKVLRSTPALDARAKQAVAPVATLLDEIIRQSPVEIDFAEQAASQSGANAQQALSGLMQRQKTRVLSPKDIQSLYGSKLAGYKFKGINVQQFVLREYNRCYRQAVADLQKERVRGETQKSGRFGTVYQTIEAAEREFIRNTDKVLDGLSTGYTEALAVLTDAHAPFNLSVCKQSLEKRFVCHKDLLENVDNMLRGRGGNSEMILNIPAPSNPQLNLQFRCNGVDGCITAMEKYSAALKDEVQAMEAHKKSYAEESFQSVDKYFTDLGQSLGPASQLMDGRMKAINCTLAFMGGQGLRFRNYASSGITKEESGLPKLPDDLMGLISSKTTPPIKNLSGEDFTQSMAGMKNALEKEQEVADRLAKLESDLSSWDSRCATKLLADIRNASGLDRAMVAFSQGACRKYQDACEKPNSSLDDLLDSLSDVFDNKVDAEGALGLSGMNCNATTADDRACRAKWPTEVAFPSRDQDSAAERRARLDAKESELIETVRRYQADASSSNQNMGATYFQNAQMSLDRFRERMNQYLSCEDEHQAQKDQCLGVSEDVSHALDRVGQSVRGYKRAGGAR